MSQGRSTEMVAARVSRSLKQRVKAAAAERGVSESFVVEEALMQQLPDLQPEAFVLDALGEYQTITVRTRHTPDGDVAEFVGGEPRELGSEPRPLWELVQIEARSRRADRTVVELVALPGDFAGVRIHLATVPTGVPMTLTVDVDDLQPGLCPRP